MIDKVRMIDDALGLVRSGHTVMVGGFGSPGTPFVLLEKLAELGPDDLTLVKNDANEPGMGISRLLEAGLARTLIASHIGLNPLAVEMMNRREIEVQLYPQGILAEKIRAGGTGLIGFLTDIGIDTVLRESRQVIRIEGREAIYEPALRADVALIRAAVGDRAGNLIFSQSGRNFCPLMAMAADAVIAEVEEVVDTGALDPDAIHLPCAFVDHLVVPEEFPPEYGVLSHHVL